MFQQEDLNSIINNSSGDNDDIDLKVKDSEPEKVKEQSKDQQSNKDHEQDNLMSEEELGERDYLALKIKTFKKNRRLNKHLKDVDITGIESAPLDEVKAKYQEIKLNLANKGANIGVCHFGYKTGCQLVENITSIPSSPINLNGFTSLQMANEDVLDILAEMEIEYSNLTSFSPCEYRLIYATLSGAIICANQNYTQEVHTQNKSNSLMDDSKDIEL